MHKPPTCPDIYSSLYPSPHIFVCPCIYLMIFLVHLSAGKTHITRGSKGSDGESRPGSAAKKSEGPATSIRPGRVGSENKNTVTTASGRNISHEANPQQSSLVDTADDMQVRSVPLKQDGPPATSGSPRTQQTISQLAPPSPWEQSGRPLNACMSIPYLVQSEGILEA